MTVQYNQNVSSISSWSFFKIIFRWKGSLWKATYKEIAIWLTAFYAITFVYSHLPDGEFKSSFLNFAKSLEGALAKITLSFLLVFFVNAVVDRWKQIFNNMGFIENVAFMTNCMIKGSSVEITRMKRTIVRYVVLSQVLVFRDVSLRVRRRFPNWESIVKSGFMTEDECDSVVSLTSDTNITAYWLPINWALNILAKAIQDGHIPNAPQYNSIAQEIKTFRTCLAQLCNYDWVPFPIAYTQVVFFAVRTYYILCLFSRQPLDSQTIDKYFPLVTIIEFIIMTGFMKVGEGLLNPFGEDDDDFECNTLIDRNITIGMRIVDGEHNIPPPLDDDIFATPGYRPVYWKDTRPEHDGALVGSAAQIELAAEQENVLMVPAEKIGEESQTLRQRASRRLRSFSRTLSVGSDVSKTHPEKSPCETVDQNSIFDAMERAQTEDRKRRPKPPSLSLVKEESNSLEDDKKDDGFSPALSPMTPMTPVTPTITSEKDLKL